MSAASLLRDPSYRMFVGSVVVGTAGGAVGALALPLVAVEVLRATPSDMGLLGAARNLPFLLLGLLAGVIVDRLRRRPILISGNVVAACALASIPIAAVGGWLSLPQLYLVAFVAGSVSVVSTVAEQSLLPSLAGRPRLLQANAHLRLAGSATDIAGSAAAGAIIQAITAPIAILIDAVASLAQAAMLSLVRVEEAARKPAPLRRMGSEVAEGLRLVLRDRTLASIMATGATHNLFSNGALVALFVLYASTVLGLSPIALGLIFAAGGPGGLLGSVIAARLGARLGMRRTLLATQVLTGIARILVPLAAIGLALPLLALGEFLLGIARAIFNVNQLSLRQALTPDHLQGRMNASIRFLMWVVTPLGALAGGVAAEVFGLTTIMWIAALGTLLASGWLLALPRRAEVAPPA